MTILKGKKFWLRLVAGLLIVLVFYLALLCFPQPFFRWAVSADNLALYSDRPFAPEDGKKILEIAQAKLATSPIYSSQEPHKIFICNSRWREMLFFNWKSGVGGLNYYPLTSNIFLRGAVIEENRLISPSGNPVAGERTLDYFITHEIAHTITTKAAGWYHHWRLPEWVREGYPDYLGRGDAFHYDEARQAFLNDAREMDRWKSGLYLRYNLLVAYLLDKEHWSVEQLLTNAIDQQTIEDKVRAEKSEE